MNYFLPTSLFRRKLTPFYFYFNQEVWFIENGWFYDANEVPQKEVPKVRMNNDNFFCTTIGKRISTAIRIQSNSVITNSMGPSVFVRYNRDIVITVKVYVVK